MYTFCERSNQSILGEISPEYSLEGRMLKLELQYFGQLMRTADSLEKTLMLGKTEGRRGQQMAGWHHWLNGHEFEQASGVGDRQGSLVCCSPWGCKESDMTEWLNWTGGSVSKEISLQCRRPGFDAWVGKIPCIRGEFHGQRNVVVYRSRGRKKLDMT